MIAAGWVGFFAGCLPRPAGAPRCGARGVRRPSRLVRPGHEPLVLAVRVLRPRGRATSPATRSRRTSQRYLVFYVTTSLPWDLGRAVLSLLVIAAAGRRLLRALRRAARRAAFDAPVVFERTARDGGPPARHRVRRRLAEPVLRLRVVHVRALAGRLRGQTSALVDDVLLLDCSPETPHAAQRAGVDLSRLRHVLITHAHPDHCSPAFLLFRSWVGDGPSTCSARPSSSRPDVGRPGLPGALRRRRAR